MSKHDQKGSPGSLAIARQGWWKAHKYLILRRLAQLSFLMLFLTGPLFGVWITKGTLAESLTLDILPLTDPFIAVQVFAAGHILSSTAIIGALITLGAYLLLGGRSYCAWVCPINPVTDLAAWARRRLGIDKGLVLRRSTRLGLLVVVLLVSAVTGVVAWEQVNPITSLHRMILFGFSWSILGLLAIFLFDLFITRNGWCGHLCPVGSFYGLVGSASLLRVSAAGRQNCDDCMDCFAVCPEQHVIGPALRGERTGQGPIIKSGDCYVCGRCIDVCHVDVFRFVQRFDERVGGQADLTKDQPHSRLEPAEGAFPTGDGR